MIKYLGPSREMASFPVHERFESTKKVLCRDGQVREFGDDSGSWTELVVCQSNSLETGINHFILLGCPPKGYL